MEIRILLSLPAALALKLDALAIKNREELITLAKSKTPKELAEIHRLTETKGIDATNAILTKRQQEARKRLPSSRHAICHAALKAGLIAQGLATEKDFA